MKCKIAQYESALNATSAELSNSANDDQSSADPQTSAEPCLDEEKYGGHISA